ncbi:NUDIX domain-containing protein [Patescibacteria group bacterium]
MKHRVRAIIIKGDKILVLKRVKKDSVYFVFPGGGVEENETKEVALRRECKEELSINVKVGELILEMNSKKTETIGQREFFYICKIISGELGTGAGPEFEPDSNYDGTHELEWLDIKNLLNVDLRPKEITLKLNDIVN